MGSLIFLRRCNPAKDWPKVGDIYLRRFEEGGSVQLPFIDTKRARQFASAMDLKFIGPPHKDK